MESRFSWIPLTAGMTVLVLSLAIAVLVVTGKGTTGLGTNQNVRTQATDVTGSMSLSPANGDYVFAANQTYPVGIVIDSAGKSVDGVDVVVNFDPKKVQVVGETISPTTMFERFPLNKVDNGRGQIQFSALTFNSKPEIGIAATFRFRPLAPGAVNFTFDFTLGKTTDSNIAEHGTAKDVLGKVENAAFNFK